MAKFKFRFQKIVDMEELEASKIEGDIAVLVQQRIELDRQESEIKSSIDRHFDQSRKVAEQFGGIAPPSAIIPRLRKEFAALRQQAQSIDQSMTQLQLQLREKKQTLKSYEKLYEKDYGEFQERVKRASDISELLLRQSTKSE